MSTIPAAGVIGLGYIGLSSPAVERWTDIFTSVIGGTPEPHSTGLRVRIDDWVHRIAIAHGDREELNYLGWQAADRVSLDEVVRRLAAAGHEVDLVEGPMAEAERGVAAYAAVVDPDGNRIELACDPDRTGKPGDSPWGCSFVTGDLGLGHVFFVSPNYRETLAFYELLGFGESDSFADGHVMFLHCNPREHSIAIADATADLGFQPGFNHFMLEVDSEAAVQHAYARCLEQGRPLAYSLGQHTNDHVTSFYMKTPAPYDVELGYGGRRIDPTTWQVTQLETESDWGHQPVEGQKP